mgnify:CR=1 FL=1
MRTLPRPPVALQDAAVALRSVTRLFGAAPALVRVDLSIERGEAVVLRGPNGAGKSTLLRIVATALSPTYGGGSVLGFDLAGIAAATPLEGITRLREWVGHGFHAGMGYMAESVIERQYRDMRILGIGGGTTQIMTSLAAKTLGYQA